jgi:hypothetical protein
MISGVPPTILFNGINWTLEEIVVTELGYLYVKLKNENENRWVNFPLELGIYDPSNNFIVDQLNKINKKTT